MHFVHKYLQIFHISWENGFVYRLNFIMWRLRVVLQMLALIFLWSAVLTNSENAFGYSTSELLTYIFGISLIRSMVFTGRTTDIQAEISSGDLNNMLVKPISYFAYWYSRDIADKLLNIIFAIGEIGLIILLLRPPLLPPASVQYAVLFLFALLAAMMLYFFFSFCISLSTFWMPEGNGWPQRFFIFVILEFLAGGLFPLDMLSPSAQSILAKLPTSYMAFTPMQVYLGRFTYIQSIQSIFIAIFWTLLFYGLAKFIFTKGTKVYGAYGR